MEKNDLIINTIVFKEQLDVGKSQLELLDLVSNLGLSKVEIRREFLKDPKVELSQIKRRADELGMTLFYSVNEDFVVGDAINPMMSQLREEAKIIAAPFVKMNTGDADSIDVSTLKEFKSELSSGLGVMVENNQTPHNATLANCRLMMEKIKEADLPISFVFDTGNWAWLGEDPFVAERELKQYTRYLHLKNYDLMNGQASIRTLGEGRLDMLSFIKGFSDVKYIALEYPCPLEILKSDIRRIID